jgi:hypothetical protein
MLLLIRRRHPAVANVLGLLTTLITLAFGIVTHHESVLIMGAFSLLLSFVQFKYMLKQRTAKAGS